MFNGQKPSKGKAFLKPVIEGVPKKQAARTGSGEGDAEHLVVGSERKGSHDTLPFFCLDCALAEIIQIFAFSFCRSFGRLGLDGEQASVRIPFRPCLALRRSDLERPRGDFIRMGKAYGCLSAVSSSAENSR
jgi:hypothetical protein